MLPFLFLLLAGLTALGFLFVVARRRQMPAMLRAILILGAVAIVVYVAWIIVSMRGAPTP